MQLLPERPPFVLDVSGTTPLFSTLSMIRNFPFVTIYTHAPENTLVQLRNYRDASFLAIRRVWSFPRRCSYVIEDIYSYRTLTLGGFSPPPSPPYRNFDDAHWPQDLTEVPGLWKYPLQFSFSNLTFLDLTIDDANYWLVPILVATDPAAPLRRVFIRGCMNYDDRVLPFPFEAVDKELGSRPEAKLLLGWAYDDELIDGFIYDFRHNLPQLNSSGRIGVLYGGGLYCKLL
jgi:hypothetical protein